MALIEIECSRPDDVRLKIATEMSLGEWKWFLQRVKEAKPQYYGPLDDFLGAIRKAIDTVQSRDTVPFGFGETKESR